MNHPFSAAHKEIIDSNTIVLVTAPDSTSITSLGSSTNYTLSVAITQYVAKATELKLYDTATINAGKAAADSTFQNNFSRLMSFMIDNAKGTLTYATAMAHTMFFNEVDGEVTSKTKVITIALIIDPIVILVLMVMFIPFILKVQSNLLKIYLHLCHFKDGEVRKWLEMCNNSTDDIKAPISRVKQIYGATSFDLNVIRNAAEAAAAQAAEEAKCKPCDTPDKTLPGATGQTIGTQHSTFDTSAQKQTEATTATGEAGAASETALRTKEEAVTERKQKMFSQMTREKTKTYLLYLLFFAAYIGAFRTADGIIFADICSETDTRLALFKMMSMRELNDLRSLFFLREEIRTNALVPYFFSILLAQTHFLVANDATETFTDLAFASEMDYSKSRAILVGSLSALRTYLGGMDYDKICVDIYSDANDISSICLPNEML